MLPFFKLLLDYNLYCIKNIFLIFDLLTCIFNTPNLTSIQDELCISRVISLLTFVQFDFNFLEYFTKYTCHRIKDKKTFSGL